jgi:hypothetical protein
MAGWVISDKVMEDVRPFARAYADFVRWQVLPGVTVDHTGTCVRIRMSPCALVVIDGVPLRDPPMIDPLTIERIVVLRPRDASTLFGLMGADGAVVITTISGRAW